jgi:LPXTG-site transpeptidase (sortase) family protein
MLGLFLAIVLGGTLHTARNSVPGVAYAQPESAPTVRNAAPGTQTPAPPVTAPARPGPAGAGVASPPAGSSPPAPPRPASPRASAPPGPAQPAGTVRLAHGGTASLVRREVGIDGVLPIPNSLLQATWWGAGLTDTTGATVLAGHVNWRGSTGPFAELWNAKVDDPVSLVDQSGTVMRYRITQIVTLHKDELPSRAPELFAQDGPHRLVLVTCGGRWIGGKEGYASNQIAIALPG